LFQPKECRSNSKLPRLVELFLSRPLVTGPLAAKLLMVTSRRWTSCWRSWEARFRGSSPAGPATAPGALFDNFLNLDAVLSLAGHRRRSMTVSRSKGRLRMLMWGTVVAFLLSLAAVGPLREISPSWLQSGAELMAVISVFALVCFLESSSSNPDRGNSAS
jgi:hypothetical protein